jgi:hypothetical protein
MQIIRVAVYLQHKPMNQQGSSYFGHQWGNGNCDQELGVAGLAATGSPLDSKPLGVRSTPSATRCSFFLRSRRSSMNFL